MATFDAARAAVVRTREMRATKKADLPTKTCARCGLPFAWRKKWARSWDDVRYCSERCRRGGASPS